jgi:ribosomal protein L10
MKTKAQKAESLKKGEDMLTKSDAVLFIDFSKVKTADLRTLRQELTSAGSKLFILKKRLLGIIFKKHNIEFNGGDMKTSVGAVFASSLESAAGSVQKFFKRLEKEKKIEGVKVLGGVDVKGKILMDAKHVIAIGSLPPREVLLAQLAMMIQAPMKQLLYVLDQKSKRSQS